MSIVHNRPVEHARDMHDEQHVQSIGAENNMSQAESSSVLLQKELKRNIRKPHPREDVHQLQLHCSSSLQLIGILPSQNHGVHITARYKPFKVQVASIVFSTEPELLTERKMYRNTPRLEACFTKQQLAKTVQRNATLFANQNVVSLVLCTNQRIDLPTSKKKAISRRLSHGPSPVAPAAAEAANMSAYVVQFNCSNRLLASPSLVDPQHIQFMYLHTLLL